MITERTFPFQSIQLLKRKIFNIKDNESEKDKAISWAKENAVNYDNSCEKIGLKGETTNFDNQILIEANQLAKNFKGLMGGPGHINFIYNSYNFYYSSMYFISK